MNTNDTLTGYDLTRVFLTFAERNNNGEPANVVDGLFAIADAIGALAGAVQRLGNGNASTDFGAIEGLAMQIREGLDGIAQALPDPGSSLNDES